MKNMIKYYDILRSPLVTEKTTIAQENNKYAFIVDIDATKEDIKKAISSVFNVTVKSVNTIVSKGKVKKFKGKIGKRKDTKKALITLADGQNIDLGIEG
jgi:large subunit ribosomal protein L23